MGCVVFSHETLKKVNVGQWKLMGKEIQLVTGNPYDERTDALFILSSSFPKIELKYLNCVTVSVLESCIRFVKVNKKLEAGTCFLTLSENTDFLMFVSVPKYIDGTLGEPDYMEKAFKEALSKARDRNMKDVTFFIDCVYPKRLLGKSFLKFLKEFISLKDCQDIKVYSNDPQLVKSI